MDLPKYVHQQFISRWTFLASHRKMEVEKKSIIPTRKWFSSKGFWLV